MAEFTEVMRQAKRMCESYGIECGPCALRKKYGLCPLCARIDDRIPKNWKLDNMTEVERIVMDWAAAHPEPRYPSWEDVWNSLFPNASEDPCPEEWFGEECPKDMECDQCLARQISKDVAEKLGIRPIEEV